MDQGITLDGGGLSRWRGEHAAGQSTGVQIPGLSPLAREHVARRRNKPNKFGLSPLARGTLVRAQ
ncbi:hypothetical protein [Escherichia coli]|uniref:hypothetical protein n=1 Tax=Escherichia coli TaxID=562 RepID=UPI003890746C